MKLEARRFSKEDIPVKVDWMNDERINHTMFFQLPASVEATEQWFENNKDNSTRADFTFLSEGEIVAMGGFTSISETNSNAEFYVMVNPEKQGMGIGKRASKWMFNYAFINFSLEKIYLFTNDLNLAAYKLYEDCGFKLEGLLRRHRFKNGALQDRRFYGLLREEWKDQPWYTEVLENEF